MGQDTCYNSLGQGLHMRNQMGRGKLSVTARSVQAPRKGQEEER